MSPRILLVDDEPHVRRVYARILITAGYEVVTVESASAALDAIRARMFDLLITDYSIDGEDGLALIARATALDPSLRCAVMSGEMPPLGTCVHWIMKPASYDDLLATVSVMAGAGEPLALVG